MSATLEKNVCFTELNIAINKFSVNIVFCIVVCCNSQCYAFSFEADEPETNVDQTSSVEADEPVTTVDETSSQDDSNYAGGQYMYSSSHIVCKVLNKVTQSVQG